ncbi:MAG: class I SAM-dependent methyltransferase [Thermoplasmata archaeon]|nr:class I SAM-dependent methyltransferase [Thermoplasmata archaeon]
MFADTVDPTRYHRMDAVVRILSEHRRERCTVLELGSGPGTLASRVMLQFPGARVVALDSDPVLLKIGREALRDSRARVSWVLADLREPNWRAALPVLRFDAVISSLSLHWLEEDDIQGVYRGAHALLRPSGLLVNPDFLPRDRPRSGDESEGTGDWTDRPGGRTSTGVRAFKQEWTKWWGTVQAHPTLRPALRDRSLRMPGSIPPRRTSGPKRPGSLEFHIHALKAAGFRRIEVRWEEGNFRAVVGRP